MKTARSAPRAELRRTRVELARAALRRHRHAERITREHDGHLAFVHGQRLPASTALAGAVHLHHALPRGETARRRDLLDEHLDVVAEELERPGARLADEVEVRRVTVRVLEADNALDRLDASCEAGLGHPLQRAIDGRAADVPIVAPNHLDEVVRAEVSFVAEERVDDQVALGRTPGATVAARRERSMGDCVAMARPGAGARDRARSAPGPAITGYTLKDDPQPQVDFAFGLRMVNPPPEMLSTKSTSAPLR